MVGCIVTRLWEIYSTSGLVHRPPTNRRQGPCSLRWGQRVVVASLEADRVHESNCSPPNGTAGPWQPGTPPKKSVVQITASPSPPPPPLPPPPLPPPPLSPPSPRPPRTTARRERLTVTTIFVQSDGEAFSAPASLVQNAITCNWYRFHFSDCKG